MKPVSRAIFAIALAFAALVLPAQRSLAAPRSPSDAIIHLEARWIRAILEGDKATVAAILSADFKHILNDGTLVDREQELTGIKTEPFAIALSEQTVDFDATGNAAVLHGLDTITQPGKATRRQRFTDVFFKEDGTWMAVSAQENVISP
jgi:Domain of unknown function (DUF4440)